MQVPFERRLDRIPRVSADLLIELTHEGFDEPFEADAVDLGLGGLSMRAPYLPEVGQRLRCRFAAPSGGARVQADCEVVWAHDSGAHVGRFGLKFVAVDDESEAALRELMDAVCEAETDADAASSREDEHGRVVLHLDGIGSPIEGRLIHKASGGVRVEQELPFLALGTGLDAVNGSRRRGRIEGVELRVDDGTPRLVLEVGYEPIGFDTVHDLPAAEASPAGAGPARDVPAGEVRAGDVPAGRVSAADVPPAPVSTGECADGPAPGTVGAAGRLLVAAGRKRAREVLAPMGPLLRRIGVLVASLMQRAGPAVAVGWSWAGARAQRLRPLLRSSMSRTRSVARLFGSSVLRRTASRGGRPRRPRRATAPPPGRSNVGRLQDGRSAARPGRKLRGRALVGLLLAFLGAGLAVYALTPRSQGEDLPVPVGASSAAAGESAGPTVDEAAPSSEPGSSSEPASAPSGGSTTAPTLTGAARPQAPGTVPEQSPYGRAAPGTMDADGSEETVPEQEEGAEGGSGTAFGAAQVSDGRSFMLRMSQPVRTLRGVARKNGFSVVVPDSLSLDRAGPIAAAHPAVERSMVLNRGDHAELTVRFVDGKSPRYRVVARGRAIEVLLEDR